MAEINQFGSTKPGNAQVCAHCEALLMDILDHTASPEDQAFFDRHLASCTSCSRMFVDAKRGGAWIDMLRNPRPEPSSDLFARILASTSGVQPVEESPAAIPVMSEFIPAAMPPVAPSPFLYKTPARPLDLPGSNILPFRVRNAVERLGHSMLQPRLAMTAAMAFFSIALTLNLTGVRLSAITAEDLKPSSIRKSFFEANAHVVRYCDNLRVVYELEARAHDLRSDDTQGSSDKPVDSNQKQKPEEQKTRPKPGPGTSYREPLNQPGHFLAVNLRTTSSLPGFTPADRLFIIQKGDLA